MSPAGPAQHLGQCERTNVLIDEDRAVELRPELIEQRHILEVGQEDIAHDPAMEQVQKPRRGNTDGEQPPGARLLGRHLRRIQDDLQHGLPAQAGPQSDLLLSHDPAGEVRQHRADAKGLEIDPQEPAIIRIEPHRHRRAPAAGRPYVILQQHALLEKIIHVIPDC